MPANKRLRRAAAAGCGVAAAVIAAALVLSSSPDGAQPARPDATESRWESLARAMTAPWPENQEPSGRLGDYTDELPGAFGDHAGTRYGDAVMGYALIQAGVRERDRRL